MSGHDHQQQNHAGSRRSLWFSFFLVAGFMLVEAVGGWLTNSLALLSDAGHMLTDAAALGLSLLAMRFGSMPPSPTKTFGYRRFEILAALLNGLALWAIVGVILHEAYFRFQAAPEVKAHGMIGVAALGLAVNLFSLFLLHGHRDENLNIRGAFLHVVADSLGSVGALAGGFVILSTGWLAVDPLVSVGICLLILWSSWGLVREAVHVLLLGVPPHIEYREVQKAILDHDGICCIYDLHIWSIASGQDAISAHVVVPDGFKGKNELLGDIITTLKTRFAIEHATLQIEESHRLRDERGDMVCRVGGAAPACSFPEDHASQE
jgi:cobalt-zinc-cadmium efflux system protein